MARDDARTVGVEDAGLLPGDGADELRCRVDAVGDGLDILRGIDGGIGAAGPLNGDGVVAGAGGDRDGVGVGPRDRRVNGGLLNILDDPVNGAAHLQLGLADAREILQPFGAFLEQAADQEDQNGSHRAGDGHLYKRETALRTN